MHRKLWARLLSCVLALSVVLAAFPKPAQAVYYVVGDGGSYALMEYFRHRWPDAGYKLWTDYPQEFRAIISNGGNAFTNYSQRWVGMDYLIGKYGVTEPEDMGTNSAEVLSQLNAARQAFDDAWAQYQETSKPYEPGGIGGGSGDSGGGDEPGGDEPTIPSGSIVEWWVSKSGYPVLDFDKFEWSVSSSGYASTYFGERQIRIYPSPYANINAYPDAVFAAFSSSITSTMADFSTAYRLDGPTQSFDFGLYASAVGDGYVSQYGAVVTSPGITVGGHDMYTWSGTVNRQTFNNGSYYDTWTSTANIVWLYKGGGGIRNDGYAPIVVTNAGGAYINGVWFPAVGPDGTTGGGTGGTVNPVPDPSTIEKPESPASPTNPQTPERDTPTIVIGGTTQTVPDPSPAPDLSTIEELLRRILANTNTIIEQMNSFASQLGQELADFYDMVYDWFCALNGWLDQLQMQMTRQLAWDNTFFDWLKAIDSDIQYLQSVCQNGFNDVTSWLQNIFNRLVQGNGGGSKPGIVDPEDPSPVMDWLRKLWTSFLADLQVVLPDQVGAVVDFLDQLRQKFPFSIPWDIAAMLALLNHSPVTPVVDIPWGYAGGIQYVHVDCHAWDDAVEIVRPMFLLLFALGLALLTRELLAGLEAVL